MLNSPPGSMPAPVTAKGESARRVFGKQQVRQRISDRASQGAHSRKVCAAGGYASTSFSVRLTASAVLSEIAEMEARCRSKGEAARWAAERLLRIREGSDFPHAQPADGPGDDRMG